MKKKEILERLGLIPKEIKSTIRSFLLLGAILSILVFFLPWSKGSNSPFLSILEIGLQDLGFSVIILSLFSLHLTLGIITIWGILRSFKKWFFWITLFFSTLTIISSVIFLFLLGLGSGLFGDPLIITFGGYAGMIGPIVIFIGVIVYKLVGKKWGRKRA